MNLRVLITAGPTREPIDPVRFIGNRSSGRMGAALAQAALEAGHAVTAILGPITIPFPGGIRRVDIETTAQLHSAVLQEWGRQDVLIMAAAVADFTPVRVSAEKLSRAGELTIACKPTPDIVAEAALHKRADQRVIGFSLESAGNIDRAREKLVRKHIDLIVFNPLETMEGDAISATLLYADGRSEPLPPLSKAAFAKSLLQRIGGLF
jgi:phosphopantothenoylcysteine decarboxylase/phosphopantothenate--cysteine ligase